MDIEAIQIRQGEARVTTISNLYVWIIRSVAQIFHLHDRGAGRPEDGAPISVRCRRGSSWPLYSGRYAASVYGQCTAGEPL